MAEAPVANTATPSPVVDAARAHLVAKLVRIMASVPNIPKNGWNEHFKYHFATEADVSAALQQRFAEERLMVFPAVTALRREGKLTVIDMRFSIVDADTGYAEDMTWAGNGEDSNDKGLWKAVTGGVKYFLLKLFLVPTGDDPEATDENGQRTNRRRREPQRQQQDNVARNPNDPAVITPAEAKRLRELIKTHGIKPVDFVASLKAHFNYDKTDDIQKRHYDVICRAVVDGSGLAAAKADLANVPA